MGLKRSLFGEESILNFLLLCLGGDSCFCLLVPKLIHKGDISNLRIICLPSSSRLLAGEGSCVLAQVVLEGVVGSKALDLVLRFGDGSYVLDLELLLGEGSDCLDLLEALDDADSNLLEPFRSSGGLSFLDRYI